VVLTGSLVTVTVSALGDGEAYSIDSIGELPAGAAAMLAVAAGALLWRRRQPIIVATTVMAVMVGWALAGYGDGQELALIVAIYAVGRYTVDQRHGRAALAAAIAVSILGTVIDANQRIDVAPAIVLTGLPWYVGHRVRNRGHYLELLQERAERLEADQQVRARQAVAAERSRIARELHDIVAHQVSMMTVQAGAAKTIARDDLDAAIDAMGDVERAGRQALGELRHLLGVLRADTADPDRLGPQPGLADIPALVDHLIQTGANVTTSLAEPPDDLRAMVDLAAYRIVQEALTNIIKHAGSNPTVDITTTADGHVLTIEITNSTDDLSPDLPRSGYGIAGMRERATLLGGALTSGPRPPDRYRVVAHLPLDPEPT
jgi:signal transduction histidine kinase